MTIVFIAFLATACAFGVFDLLPDIKARSFKIPAVYVSIMLCSVVLCFLVLRDVNLKSPSEMVTAVVKAIFPSLK